MLRKGNGKSQRVAEIEEAVSQKSQLSVLFSLLINVNQLSLSEQSLSLSLSFTFYVQLSDITQNTATFEWH